MHLKAKINYEGNPLHDTKHLFYIQEKTKLIAQVQTHIKDVLDIKNNIVLKSGQYTLPTKESISLLENVKLVDCYVIKTITTQKQKKLNKKQQKNSRKTKLQSDSSSDVQISVEVKQPTKKLKMNTILPLKKVYQHSQSSSSNSISSDSESESNKSVPIQKTNSKKIQIQLPPKRPISVLQQKPVILNQKNTNNGANQDLIVNKSQKKHSITKNRHIQQHRTFKLFGPSTQVRKISKQPSKILLETTQKSQFPKESKLPDKKRVPALSKIVIQQAKEIQEDQWKNIQMKDVQKYNKSQGKGFLQVGNQIKYKITQFDQQKYLPILSDWIQAKVLKTSGNGELTLFSKGKQTKLSQINLFGLMIKAKSISQSQKIIFLGTNDANILIQKIENQKQSAKKNQKQASKPTKEQKVISQMNYYFGDANYNNDNYLLMHASKNKQLYIPLNRFMNFNKLKPLISNEEQLEKIIRGADLSNALFQVHPIQKWVRKKGLRIQEP